MDFRGKKDFFALPWSPCRVLNGNLWMLWLKSKRLKCWKNRGTYHGLNGIHQRGKFWMFAETSQKGNVRSTCSIAPSQKFFYPGSNSARRRDSYLGLLESLRDVVSERSSERKKPTSIDFQINWHLNLELIFFVLNPPCLPQMFFHQDHSVWH